ncbi:MAG: 2-C-methyl-D-erythritol 4-phosphate cytidylyltransferase [Solirubrobacterales bacterium]
MIAAAGSGERLGAGGPKAFVELAGRALLAWSLAAFEAAESVAEIIVAAPPGDEGRARDVAVREGVEIRATPGGDARSQSVGRAVDLVGADLVVVHDAARPLVQAELVDEIVGRLAVDDDLAGVIAAAPVTDTVKEGSHSRRVIRTPEREHLWAAQTPQAFRTSALRDAIADHPDLLGTVSDDAMLVERAGGQVLLHRAPPENLKVTTPLDLRIAELVLAERSL